MKNVLKMKTIAAIFCSVLLLSFCCPATMKADDETKNRKEVRTFYNSLLTAKDHSVLDEIFIPEGTSKEQHAADLKARRLANDSIRKAGEQRRAALRAERSAQANDSLRKIKEQLRITLSNDSLRKIKEQRIRIALANDSLRKFKKQLGTEKTRIELSREHNQDLLKRKKELAKYLTVDENGLLKPKGKIDYEEIINNSELSVRKRKEVIGFLYYIENGPFGKKSEKINLDDDCVTAVAAAFGFIGASVFDDAIRDTIELAIQLLGQGKSTSEISSALHTHADQYLPMVSDFTHNFIDTNFDLMLDYISLC
jgi:hypothetical protein